MIFVALEKPTELRQFFLIFAILLSSFSLTSCAVTANSTPATNAAISAAPSSVNFGNVKVKAQVSQNVKLSNVGNSDLVISKVALVGTNFGTSGLEAPITIAAGSSVNFTVTFQPSKTGSASGTVSITSNVSGGAPFNITLVGTGIAEQAPVIDANPTIISFGSLAVQTSASQTVKISNTGNATLSVSQVTVSGTGFSMSGLSAPVSIPAGSSTNFTVTFQPTTTGSASGSVSISSNAANSPLSIPLSGTGTAAPVAPSITSQPVSQTITAGQTATFSVAATGTAPLSYQWKKNGSSISGATGTTYTTPATTTSDNGSTFTVVVTNSAGSATSNAATLTVNAAPVAPSIATQPASQTVTAGQTATFSVAATGTAPLSYQWKKNGSSISGATGTTYTTPATTTSDNGLTFTVVVTNSAGSASSNAATLTVNAAPVPMISVIPSSVNFGSLTVQTSASQTIKISNTGNATLSISQATVSGTGFSMSGLSAPVSVPAGSSINFTVAFQPTTAGSASGSVSISSNAANSPLSIPLSGTGVAATIVLTPNPTSLAFGNVNVSTPSTMPVQLANSGNSTVTITSATTTGTGFSSVGGSNVSLTPGQSVTVTVTFNPLSAGPASGNLSVLSNAPALSVPLSGIGVSPVQHSVSLAWDPPSPATGVTGYAMYRRTGTSGSFTKIASIPSPATTFTDTTVEGGQTYFYEVTSVDSNNDESDVDGPVQVTVPSP